MTTILVNNLPVGGCPLGPYVLSDKLIPLLSCAVNEPNRPTADLCDRVVQSSATASPKNKSVWWNSQTKTVPVQNTNKTIVR